MTAVSPLRKNIQIEEVQYKSSISEATGFKIGGALNFINERQYDTKQFYINGNYSLATELGSQAVDGAYLVLHDCEIIGCAVFNIIAGSSGTTTLNIRRYTASNTPSGGASIFDVKPSIASSAGNYAFVFKRFQDDTTLENPAGTTLPTLAITDLNAGDMLVIDIDDAQVGAENCGLILFTRPR